MTDQTNPSEEAGLAAKARRVLELASSAEIPIATAESCTGGQLASLLTDITGLSHIFDRGFVVYSDDAKCDLLGIERERISRCGAVSREVALAMAHGALRRAGEGVAIAITGFAGPAGEDDEEGLVHFACVRSPTHCEHREEHFGPIGRDGVRQAALAVALDMVESAVRS